MVEGDALDPRHYIEHVTRTVLLLEQLARDVRAVKDLQEASAALFETLRLQSNKTEKDFAVYQVGTDSKIATNQESIRSLEERLRWLSRLVIGAVVTGIIGGVIALVMR